MLSTSPVPSPTFQEFQAGLSEAMVLMNLIPLINSVGAFATFKFVTYLIQSNSFAKLRDTTTILPCPQTKLFFIIA